MNNREDKIEKQVILLGGYCNMLDGEWRRSAVQAGNEDRSVGGERS